MSAFEIASLLVIGLAGGLFGGLLGIGGSVVVIPGMTFALGPDQQLYQSAAMVMNVAVAASATWRHARRGAIDRTTVFRLLPVALMAIIAGVLLSNALPGATLRRVFGAFLLLLAVSEIVAPRKRAGAEASPAAPARAPDGTNVEANEASAGPLGAHDPGAGSDPPAGVALADEAAADDAAPTLSRPAGAAIGGVTGFLAGLLGIGGGVVMVPLVRRVGRLPIRQAIPASAAVMLVTASIGSVQKLLSLRGVLGEDGEPVSAAAALLIAAVLVPTAFIGGAIGATLVHHFPARFLRIAFIGLLLVASARMIWPTG